ncbi:MAG: exodeoxyribonuclease VII large subunit [Magnetococcales bacterium]|nr:exodeoxyribonuclease VII large subunit [Magnetococcales bacterium]
MNSPTPADWQTPISVSTLNERIRTLLEEGFPLVRVKGEILDLKAPASGHLYFSLADADSRIRAVVWRTTVRRLGHTPRAGEALLVTGRIAVYAPRGEYQLVVEALEPAGAGAERERLLALHARLAAEGLFAPGRKRPLPFFPATVGVVTSASGAAIHDIRRVLERRFPGFHLILSPARVQGNEAPEEIAAALGRLDADGRAEVIICGRGGGSTDDLAAFNAEPVVRAIAASRIPVVSAVGHEVDLTLADLVADARASTPSAAAELVMPDALLLQRRVTDLNRRLTAAARVLRHSRGRAVQELHGRLRHPAARLGEFRAAWRGWHERLRRAGLDWLARRQERLDDRHELLQGRRPTALIALFRARLQQDRRLLEFAARGGVRREQQRLATLQAHLFAVSPLGVLDRGFAVVQHEDGALVRDAAAITTGERLTLTLAKGKRRVTALDPEESSR